MKSLVVVTMLALLVACAPDRSDFGQVDGAPIDQAIVDAATQAGIDTCPASGSGGSADADSDLSGIELVCLATGEAVDLADFEGPVVLNVWAHWCEPCREEMPLLVRAAEEYAGRVTFVGVVFADEDPSAAIDLASEFGVTYPQVADINSDLRVPLKLRGLPTTAFIIDGEIRGTQLTPYDDYGVLTSDIAEHLEVEP